MNNLIPAAFYMRTCSDRRRVQKQSRLMSSRTPRLYLEVIALHIDRAWNYTSSLSKAAFLSDDKTCLATVRCLEVIPEASRRLPDDLKLRHSHIPWQQIAAAGNIYRHGEHAVTYKTIWNTVTQHLQPLRTVVAQELVKLDREAAEE